jgi:cytoskeletal protein CcmA (bactofilin family)
MASNPARSSSSWISQGTRISGKLNFGEMAVIHGEAEGEITGNIIEIAASAVVMARITANRLKISGQVNGEIVARERLELLPPARVRCTIITPTLIMTEGAQFDGDCKMPRAPTSSAEPESEQAEPESEQANEAGVPFRISAEQRAKLRERGYSDDDIAQMMPAVGRRILGLE